MTLPFRTLVLLASLGSALLLASAFLFQSLGYLPCAMCLWQRWPHAAAVVIGLATYVFLPFRWMAALGGLAALSTAGIGIFHTGVERDWWEGPASCTGSGGLSGLEGGALLPGAADAGPRLIMCDQVSWELMGLSMPSWNALFSLILAVLWFTAAARGPASAAPARR
ncbi:putative disulfide bond formation protein DsbB [Oceanicola granulosus HTCC2516]|uniref:Putative disulfide bond formation protein DsbB n=1 Tax=Oceanicola granulosus (strain ATCC BAA-861 / DSM 15982 / KCTC 12143 / HTCC2516) TaxID=314256 RepID=Q2CD01_OCEGH|nr:disulfide bond formation protein B [Oceanicola granulosus]EAR50575.1 putative disulfide bond formation protein DsbB [Oceanicola granulosus HTCC2516]